MKWLEKFGEKKGKKLKWCCIHQLYNWLDRVDRRLVEMSYCFKFEL